VGCDWTRRTEQGLCEGYLKVLRLREDPLSQLDLPLVLRILVGSVSGEEVQCEATEVMTHGDLGYERLWESEKSLAVDSLLEDRVVCEATEAMKGGYIVRIVGYSHGDLGYERLWESEKSLTVDGLLEDRVVCEATEVKGKGYIVRLLRLMHGGLECPGS